MEKLDAVNNILRGLGQRPVTSLTAVNPLKDMILQDLDQEQRTLLNTGYWFNTQIMELTPDSTGAVARPTAVLGVLSPYGYEFRGGFLINPLTGISYFDPTKKVRLSTRITLAFNELPDVAADVLWRRVLCTRYLSQYGTDSSYAEYQRLLAVVDATFKRDQIRNLRCNTRATPEFQRISRLVNGG